MPDWGWPVLLLAMGAAVGIAYFVRQAGTQKYERLEKLGTGPLLGKHAIQAGYWALQPVGRGLKAAGIGADAITVSSLVFALAAAVALADGRYGLGATLMMISLLSDAVDGLVARATGTAGPAGAVLDASIDRYVEFVILAGVLIDFRDDTLWLVACLGALLGSYMVSYVSVRAEASGVPVPRGAMRRVERAVYLVVGAVLSGLLQPWSAAWTAHGWPEPLPMALAVAFVAVVANVSAVLRLRALLKALRPVPSRTYAFGRRTAP